MIGTWSINLFLTKEVDFQSQDQWAAQLCSTDCEQ